MSDERADVAAEGVAVETQPTEKPGFFSTLGGRILLIALGLVVLAIIAGIAVTVVLRGLVTDLVDDAVLSPDVGVVTGETGVVTTGTVDASGPATEVANSAVYTFRDIFDPLLKPLPEPASSDSTATPSTTDTETPYAQSVLYLDGVETVDGVMKADLRYNGQTYTLGPGEGIPGTPWEVLSVSSTSVTMLYGDHRVTLAVGQGISK